MWKVELKSKVFLAQSFYAVVQCMPLFELDNYRNKAVKQKAVNSMMTLLTKFDYSLVEGKLY